jgi:hypothetical protein
MLCPLTAGTLAVLRQKNSTFVVLKQNVVLYLVTLSFQEKPCPTDCGMKSSEPTSSVSVELRVLSFCLMALTTGKPLPRDNPPPECPRMLGWTAKEASTHHLRMPLPSALRISGSFRVPRRYFIRCTNFLQSCSSGCCTLEVRNATEVQVSGLARLVANNVFATKLWNCTDLSDGSFGQSSSTLNRSIGAALALVPPLSGSAPSKTAKIFQSL